MATRTRETNAAGNERRRGTSPSSNASAGAAQRRRSPNPPKVEEKKNVPNYLRPTASSGPDASNHQGKKKPAADGAAHKPVLGRRTSFDRPPPSSSAIIRTNSNPARAPSPSGKTAAAVKSVSQKNSRGPKVAGKHQGLQVSKKSSTTVKKREIGGGSDSEKEQDPTEKLEVSSLTDASEPDNFSDNPESPLAESDARVIGISGQDIGAADPPTDKHEIVAMDRAVGDEEDAVIDIDSGGHVTNTAIIANIEPSMENEEVESGTIEAPPHSTLEDDKDPHTIQETIEIQETPNKEMEAKGPMEEEVKDGVKATEEAEGAVAAARGGGATQGKKESTVSNDVIEETARQLREQRKNRVRALAGAFETVISLQEPK